MAKIVTLPAEVAAKYELVGWVGGHRQVFGTFGVIDLSKLTLRKADSLYTRGFSKLKLKQQLANKNTPVSPTAPAEK